MAHPGSLRQLGGRNPAPAQGLRPPAGSGQRNYRVAEEIGPAGHERLRRSSAPCNAYRTGGHPGPDQEVYFPQGAVPPAPGGACSITHCNSLRSNHRRPPLPPTRLVPPFRVALRRVVANEASGPGSREQTSALELGGATPGHRSATAALTHEIKRTAVAGP